MAKNLPANAGDARDEGSIPGLRRSPGEGNGNPLQYSCLEKFHGQRSLAGYSSWGRKETDTTQHAHTHTLLKIIFANTSVQKRFKCGLRLFILQNTHSRIQFEMANPRGCFRIVVEFGITFFLPLFSKLSNVARLLFQGFIITSGNFPDHICITHLNRYHKHVVKIYVQKRYIEKIKSLSYSSVTLPTVAITTASFLFLSKEPRSFTADFKESMISETLVEENLSEHI